MQYKINKYHGDYAPSVSMMKKWFRKSCCDSTSMSGAERSGCTTEVASPKLIYKNPRMVFRVQRLRVLAIE